MDFPLNVVVRWLVPGIENAIAKANQMNKAMEQTNKWVQGQVLSKGLSMIFGGMWLEKTFGGALKAMQKTYDDVFQNQANLYDSTIRVTAAFEFLKFSIFNALMQSELFQGMISFLVNAINWVSEYITKNKELAIGIGAAFGLFAIGGTILSNLGNFAMFYQFFLRDLLQNSDGAFWGISQFFKTHWGTILDLVKAGIIIKAGWDLLQFMNGEKTLRETIDSIGTDMAFLGLVSGQPWIIAAGIAMKLLPWSDTLKSAGRGMFNKSWERMQEGKGSAFSADTLLGGLGMLGGSALFGVGSMGSYVNDKIDEYDRLNKNIGTNIDKSKGLSVVVLNSVIPATVIEAQAHRDNAAAIDEETEARKRSLSVVSLRNGNFDDDSNAPDGFRNVNVTRGYGGRTMNVYY